MSTDEPVLEIDSVLQRSRLDLARREHQAASAQSVQSCLGAERSARELTRNRRLAEEGILSADLLDAVDSAARAAAAACDATRAAASASRASVELAERELEKTVLRSPFEGVIAELTIEVGEWTTPSPPALPVPAVLDILDPASIYVSAPMDEVDSARIRPDQAVRVTIDSHPGKSFPGRILAVAPYVLDLQEQNRTVEIEVELQDAALAASLLPGTSADVEVILQAREEVLRIPTSALLAGDKVLLLTDGELVERPVQIGIRNWDLTEIAAGLVEGDEIVVSLDRPEVKAGAKAVASAQATKP